MFNTHTKTLKSVKSSFLLVVAASLLCFAGLGTTVHASAQSQPKAAAAEASSAAGHACVVIRRSGARGAGHIGWAVEISHNRYLFGAVEGKSPSGHLGWTRTGSWGQMLQAFQRASAGRYDAIKCVDVARPNTGGASGVAGTMPTRSRNYHLFTNNCLRATYDVLRAYATPNLPTPSLWRIAPNFYYGSFGGREFPLHR